MDRGDFQPAPPQRPDQGGARGKDNRDRPLGEKAEGGKEIGCRPVERVVSLYGAGEKKQRSGQEKQQKNVDGQTSGQDKNARRGKPL
jgi:hypothetical protein